MSDNLAYVIENKDYVLVPRHLPFGYPLVVHGAVVSGVCQRLRHGTELLNEQYLRKVKPLIGIKLGNLLVLKRRDKVKEEAP